MFCIYLNFIYFKYESQCSIKKLINIEIANHIYTNDRDYNFSLRYNNL